MKKYLVLFLALFACHRAPSPSVGSTVIQPAATGNAVLPINLAGGSGVVTGALPDSNQAAQTSSGDVTGNTGATIVSAITGTSPIVVTPNELQFKNTATPLIDQAPLASTSADAGVTGTTATIAAQNGQAATGATHNGGTGGNLAIQSGTGGTSGSATAGVNGYIDESSGSAGSAVQVFQDGLLFGQTTYGARYPGNVVPSASNYLFYCQTSGAAVAINAGSTLNLNVSGTPVEEIAGTAVQFGQPVGGIVQFQWLTTASAITCGTGGTQTISTAQAIRPGLIVTTGTLSSNCVLDFSTNAANGWYTLDMSGATVGSSFGIQFKNGTATNTILSSGVLTGQTLATVWTHGTNTLAVNW